MVNSSIAAINLPLPSSGPGGVAVRLKLASHRNWVTSVTWCHQDAHRLASASLDGTVKVWDIRSTTPVHTMSMGAEDRQLCVSWEAGCIWSGGEGGKVHSHVFQ